MLIVKPTILTKWAIRSYSD